jgi:hypothetical protein
MKIIFALVVALTIAELSANAQKHVQPADMTIVRPFLTVPDSLGGPKLKGYAEFILRVHVLGTILSSHLSRIWASTDGSEPTLIYSDATNSFLPEPTPVLARFRDWLDEYLARTQFRFCFEGRDPGWNLRVQMLTYTIYFNPNIRELPPGHGYE